MSYPSFQNSIFSRALDFISIMTYDYNGAWNKVTGHASPLYHRSEETGLARTYNAVSMGTIYFV